MKPSWKYRTKFQPLITRHDTLLFSMPLPQCPSEHCLENDFYWHISSVIAPVGISLHGNGRVTTEALLRTLRKWFSKTFNYKESQFINTSISSVSIIVIGLCLYHSETFERTQSRQWCTQLGGESLSHHLPVGPVE